MSKIVSYNEDDKTVILNVEEIVSKMTTKYNNSEVNLTCKMLETCLFDADLVEKFEEYILIVQALIKLKQEEDVSKNIKESNEEEGN